MNSIVWRLVVAAPALHFALVPWAPAQPPPRKLVPVTAARHVPLFVDADSVRRRGRHVDFKYLLDVQAPDGNGLPGAWRSNEIDASIDCSRRLVTVHRLIAYSERRGSGAATTVHAFTAPGARPEPITPKSTFAYLEAQLCVQQR